jgi:hypothetical protein
MPGRRLQVEVEVEPSVDHLKQLIACVEASLLSGAEALDHFRRPGPDPVSERARLLHRCRCRVPVLTLDPAQIQAMQQMMGAVPGATAAATAAGAPTGDAAGGDAPDSLDAR